MIYHIRQRFVRFSITFSTIQLSWWLLRYIFCFRLQCTMYTCWATLKILTLLTLLYTSISFTRQAFYAQCVLELGTRARIIYMRNFNNSRLNCSSGSQYEMWGPWYKWNERVPSRQVWVMIFSWAWIYPAKVFYMQMCSVLIIQC